MGVTGDDMRETNHVNTSLRIRTPLCILLTGFGGFGFGGHTSLILRCFGVDSADFDCGLRSYSDLANIGMPSLSCSNAATTSASISDLIGISMTMRRRMLVYTMWAMIETFVSDTSKIQFC